MKQKSVPAETAEQHVREIRRASALVRLSGKFPAAQKRRGQYSSCSNARSSWRLPTAPSFLWFTAIQSIEGEERLADLSPQGCFVAAEAVERAIGQIGETQEAVCELDGMRDVRLNRFRPQVDHFFRDIGHPSRCRIDIDHVGAAE